MFILQLAAVCCLTVLLSASCGTGEKATMENGDFIFTYNREGHNFDLMGFGARVRIQKARVQFQTQEDLLDLGDGDFQHAYDQGRFDTVHGSGEYFTVTFTDPWQRHDGGTTFRMYDEGRRFSVESWLTNTSKEALTVYQFQPLTAYPELGGGVTVGGEASTVSAVVQGPNGESIGPLPFADMTNRQGISSWQSVALVQPEKPCTILMAHIGTPGLVYQLSLDQPADKKIGPPLSVILAVAFQDPAGPYEPHAQARYGPATVAPGDQLRTGEVLIQFLDRAVDNLSAAVSEFTAN